MKPPQPEPTRGALRPTLIWSSMAFVRFGAMGFSLILPLLGAATIEHTLSTGDVVSLCAVAACFHVFAFVHNDVIDLPLDRTEPRRADFPLVRGVVSPAVALGVALLQIPVSLGIAVFLDAGRAPLVTLSVAYGLMTVYNLYGKNTRVPWFTDAIQGLAWAMIGLFGVLGLGARPTLLTSLTLSYLVVYVVMVNGIHGGMRDLPNDVRRGAMTTAILMGAHVAADGRTVPGPLLFGYAIVLQVLLFGIAIVAVSMAMPASSDTVRYLALAVVVGSGAAAALLVGSVTHALGRTLDTRAVGLLHMVFTLIPLMAMTGPGTRPWIWLTMIGLFLGPLVTLHSAYPSARWLRQRLGRTGPSW